ncbi:ABC transporter ATP-binding protein [Rhodospirillum centenum]|uniref:ABC transporter, ATP-binding protein n=1 Tax=Rhodospirillum centenum (strain ATCC 51521 / SW) TaxID=414684 RepID=B6IS15_RHOCS|nr:ABC transporter ATP-binding protein [Rhodospirillum centenum]ACI98251.1 ABC transporter, ATP-binding protein [Rhodospirillum centenum SW]
MSSEPVIRASGLCKRYPHYDRPWDRLRELFGGRGPSSHFAALDDVSFEIGRGEQLAIIGRNGAGKSTLLQLLCGTLTPTAGLLEVRGRIAALLELGAGFNPDFTGRENALLNAQLLGLTRHQALDRFEEIAAFAEIGDFLDRPVKTYSSGMFVRLAFAVAVHTDPDILIVDEALSVGDAFFQAKCMARMRDMIDSGLTVIFVSHDLSAVKSVCSRGLYLERGRVRAAGPIDDVVECYVNDLFTERQAGLAGRSGPVRDAPAEPSGAADAVSDSSGGPQASPPPGVQAEFERLAAYNRVSNGRADFICIGLFDEADRPVGFTGYGGRIILRMWLVARAEIPELLLGAHVRNTTGLDVLYTDTVVEGVPIRNLVPGQELVVDWEFPADLAEGRYTITAVASEPVDLENSVVDFCDYVPIAAQIEVGRRPGSPLYGCARLPAVIRVTGAMPTDAAGKEEEPLIIRSTG